MTAMGTYERACAQIGISVHPALSHGFASYAECVAADRSSGRGVLKLCHRRGHREPPVEDADVVAVCLALRSLASVAVPLVELDLTGQHITCEGARTIAAVMQVHCGLHIVRLRQTRVGDEGAAALGAALGATLVELDLGESGMSDMGVRLLARGIQLHPPPALSVLLLDGNMLSDAGILDIIALIEGPNRPRALSELTLHPSSPRSLSVEVDAALRVVCQMYRITLPEPSHRTGPIVIQKPVRDMIQPPGSVWTRTVPDPGLHQDSVYTDDSTNASCIVDWGEQQPLHQPQYWQRQQQWQQQQQQEKQHLLQQQHQQRKQLQRSASGARLDGFGIQSAPPTRATFPVSCDSSRALAVRDATSVGQPSCGASLPDSRNEHLAAWMATTDRELRDLKQLLSGNVARLDGQHASLIRELTKIHGQLDLVGSSMGKTSVPDDVLESLEARFDALERVVGREQTECSEMRRLVESSVGEHGRATRASQTQNASPAGAM